MGLSLSLLTACAESEPVARDDIPFAPEYGGAEAEALDADLVRIGVTMRGARDAADVRAYADCALAGYADVRGFEFARHIRTTLSEASGLWKADAFYTMSPTIPQGVNTLETQVVVTQCNETGIPLV